MNQLESLLSRKKINKQQYDTYMLFGATEDGRAYLRHLIDFVLTEQSPHTLAELAWLDGRRSWVREIKVTIDGINLLMKEANNGIV